MFTADRIHRKNITSTLLWFSILIFPTWAFGAVGTEKAGAVAEAQTLEDIERVGAAIFAWLVDQRSPSSSTLPVDPSSGVINPSRSSHQRAPVDEVGATSQFGLPTFDMHDVPVITATDLEALLVPTYLESLPATDGWGEPYEFRLDPSMVLGPPFIAIRSMGANGAYSGTTYSPGFTAGLEDDVVWVDGMFVRRHPPSAAEAADYTAEVVDIIGRAAISWKIDQVGSLAVGSQGIVGLTGCDGHQVDIATVPVTTADAIESLLAPGYLTFLPRMDGWQNALDFRFDSNLAVLSDWIAIRSAGSDGTFESTQYTAGFTTADTEDLVALDTFAIRRPPVIGEEQEETLVEIQVLGNLMFSWVVDNSFQAPAPVALGSSTFDVGELEPITHQDLEALLVPFYVPCLPKTDFWGFDYEYWLDVMNLFSVPLAGIRSRGSDGTSEGPVYSTGPFPGASTEQDLLWVDGFFIRYPDPSLVFLDGFETGDVSGWASSERTGPRGAT